MPNPCSAIAYAQIQASGKLAECQRIAHKIVYELGIASGNDVARGLIESGHASSPTVYRNAHARLSELEALGVIGKVGTAVDCETGMKVTVWAVTDKMPTKVKKDRLKYLNEQREKLLARLTAIEDKITKTALKLRAE